MLAAAPEQRPFLERGYFWQMAQVKLKVGTPLTCMSVLAMKPLPSESHVWKNSCAFLHTILWSGTCSSTSNLSGWSSCSTQVPLFCHPGPGIWELESPLSLGVAIRPVDFFVDFQNLSRGDGKKKCVTRVEQDRKGAGKEKNGFQSWSLAVLTSLSNGS